MAYVLGIDIGSALSKAVVLGDQGIVGTCVIPSGGNYRMAALEVKEQSISDSGLTLKDIAYTVATGYGAGQVEFADEQVTDITCHSRGILHLFPAVRTAVEVGDLYSKAFRMDGDGNVVRFLLSSKCAGGSARVLKIIAKVLQVNVEDLGELSLRSKNRVDFGTGCAVFAETEAVSRVAEGVAKEDLLAGFHRALAAQLSSMAERVGVEKEFALVGGGARDIGLVKAMEEQISSEVIVPSEPHLTGALGAAVIGHTGSGFPPRIRVGDDVPSWE